MRLANLLVDLVTARAGVQLFHKSDTQYARAACYPSGGWLPSGGKSFDRKKKKKKKKSKINHREKNVYRYVPARKVSPRFFRASADSFTRFSISRTKRARASLLFLQRYFLHIEKNMYHTFNYA